MKKSGSIYNRLSTRKIEPRYLIVIVAAITFSLLIAFSAPVRFFEWHLLDLFARWKNASADYSASVAVVLIDDEVINRPHGWPVAKSVYEELALYLLEMGASAVAFDVLFANDLSCADNGDSQFLHTVSLNDNIVFAWLAYTADTLTGRPADNALSNFCVSTDYCEGLTAIQGTQLPYGRLLKQIKSAGFMNRGHAFADNIERRMPLIAQYGDSAIVPSLALAAVMKSLDIDSIQLLCHKNLLILGNRSLACDKKGEMLLDFSVKIPTYRLSDIQRTIEAWLHGIGPSPDSLAFNNKIVFVGNGAVSLQDFGVTPISRISVMPQTPNVLLHAQSAATQLSGHAPWCISTVWYITVICLLQFVLAAVRHVNTLWWRFLIAMLPFIFIPPFAAYFLYGKGIVFFPIGIFLSAGIFILCDFVAAQRYNIHPADAPKAYQGNNPFVFISYKHEELRQASRIMFQLQAMKCRIWYDRGIEPGIDYEDALKEKVRNSQCFFFIASPDAILSTYIQKELEWALESGKEIFAVCINKEIHELINSNSNETHKINPTVLAWCRKSQMIDLYNREFKHLLKKRLMKYGVIR
jgi:hypothetical protein